MHRYLIRVSFERDNGWRLATRQQFTDGGQGRAGRVQHDVLALADLLHAINAHEQPFDPGHLVRGQSKRRAHQNGIALQHRLDFAQPVGNQCGARRDEIADGISPTEPRRNLHGT